MARAMKMARQSSARSLELRAALTLVRLREGGRDEGTALALLREVQGRFTEGSATPDLVEATTLLAAGAGAPARRRRPRP